ncbi:MAG: Xylose operon regulatory protein [Opitutia bacterium UBA7350]|nr:MAG: Xylose operon regulatory protein [Opitutae bacterium UBA7350]
MSRNRKVLMLLGSYDALAHAGIARAARELNWHLDVSLLKTFQFPVRWEGEGIITSLNQSQRLLSFIRRAKLPTVDLSTWRSDIKCARVAADNEAIGRAAAEHLVALGHQNYAWFALSRNPVGEARFKGFREALPSTVQLARLDGRGAQLHETTYKRLKSRAVPLAVFCKSDDEAAWLLNLCLNHQIRIPEEIAILGVDNNPLICEYQPVPLSSVNHDLERIGYEGALRLDALIEGAQFPGPLLIPPRSVTQRQSTDELAVSDPAVRIALEYMQTQLRRSIGTEDIARVAGISRRSLEIRFKEQMHVSVHERLIETRLYNAMQLFADKSHSITDIAALSGFCNAPHFTRTFKKKHGTTPLKYRKQFFQMD